LADSGFSNWSAFVDHGALVGALFGPFLYYPGRRLVPSPLRAFIVRAGNATDGVAAASRPADRRLKLSCTEAGLRRAPHGAGEL